jgi:hypothetical protein
MNTCLPRLRAVVSTLAFAISTLVFQPQTVAEVWNLPAGGSYNTAGNWKSCDCSNRGWSEYRF